MKKLQAVIITGLLFFMSIPSGAVTLAAGETWSMGFFTPWGDPPIPVAEIQWEGLTHIAQFAAVPQSDGSLQMTFADNHDAVTRSLISNAHANNVKVMLCIWQNGPGDFYGAVENHRGTLISNIMKLVNDYGYDGVDLDWETNFDENLMTLLLNDIRDSLDTKLLSADVDVMSYNYWKTVYKKLDRVNVMTYDVNGTWDPFSWYSSALYSPPPGNQVWSIHLARQRFNSAGIPLSKLNIGIPFYGYIMNGVSRPKQNTKDYSKTAIRYYEIVEQYDLSTANWDDEAKVPWLPLDGAYVTYDNERSVTAKVNYVMNEGLGGWIIWALDEDYLPGESPQTPLMNAIKDAMVSTAVRRIDIKKEDMNIRIGYKTLYFTLTTNASVTIKLFDISGRLVMERYLGVLSPGDNSFSLAGEGLPAGMYIVNLAAGSRMARTKILIGR